MSVLRGAVSMVAILAFLVVGSAWLCVLALLRLLAKPVPALSRLVDSAMDRVIDGWAWWHRGLISGLALTRIEQQGAAWREGELSRERWYLVLSNHQTWVDILVLQTQLVDRVPPLKFFTKKQLLWVPFLGVAMWLLGFPYVNRYSRAQVEADPSLRDRDRDNVRAACEGVRKRPTCILNFLEGTRFRPAKHAAQESTYQHLLMPRIGGVGVAMDALNDRLDAALDITLVYPDGVPSYWDFLCGRCPQVVMKAELRELPQAGQGEPEANQRALISWVDELWSAKDEYLGDTVGDTRSAK